MRHATDWLKYQQLEQISLPKIETRHSKPIWSRLKTIWQLAIAHLIESSELRVWYTCDQEGKLWWSAYDPKTRRAIHQISEEQMRVWIEQRYS